jgi:hypothetical protein
MPVRVLLVVLGAVSCWVGPGSGRAEAAEPGAEEQGEQEMLRRGVSLREQGKDLDALEVFRQAFERWKAPKARAQMGLAEQALGRWVDAEAHLEEALAAADPWISGNRGTLEHALGVIRDRLGSLEVLCDVPAAAAAEVIVDGQARGKLPLDRPLRVAAGTVMVQVQGKGFAPVHRHVTVLAGQLGRESFVLVPVAPEAPAAPASFVTASPGGDDRGARRGWPRPVFYGGVVATALLAAVATWSGLDTLHANDRYQQDPTRAGFEDGRSRENRTNWLFGGTAVVAISTALVGALATDWSSR